METIHKNDYMYTELGLIPKDWKITNIVEISTLKARIGWQGLTTAEYKDNGDYLLVTGTDFLDGRIDWDNCHFVEKFRYEQDRFIQLKVGDVLITKDGTIGKVSYIDSLPLKATLNSGVFVIRPKENTYTPKYLYYLFNSQFFRIFLGQLVAGSTINHLYQKDFVKFTFPLPNKKEQTAIATALSDMDSYISRLESLIVKKRLIKQGAVQELLTPKEDWEVKKLGEIGEFKNGINKGEEDFGFGHPFVNLLDVFGKKTVNPKVVKGLVNSSILERKLYSLKKGDILFIRSSVKPEGVGLTSLIADDLEDTVFSGFLIRFRDNGFLNYHFKIHCFYTEDFRRRLIESSTISANTNINQNSLKQLDLYFPSFNEQKRIGELLNSLDSGILAVQSKLQKAKLIKQGMMQNLLTGRVRLL